MRGVCMLNEDKIRIMSRCDMYEKDEKKGDAKWKPLRRIWKKEVKKQSLY